jgi:hypothetical protein
MDTSEEAKMSAEKGWIGEPQPETQWHTPGWLSEKGTGFSHFHAGIKPLLTALKRLLP